MAEGHTSPPASKPKDGPYVREAKNLYTALVLLGHNLLASKVLECSRAVFRHECLDCEALSDVRLSCDHRLCPLCARRRSARFTDRHHTAISKITEPSLLTLTFKSLDHLTKASITTYIQAFARLRQQKLWRTNVRGGLAGLELTHRDAGWHPHFHSLLDNSYIPVSQLSKAWRKASKGSYIVDIRRCNPTTAIQEVAKYVAKGSSFYKAPYLLEQFMLATKGRRFYTTFGSFYRSTDEPLTEQLTTHRQDTLPAVDNSYYPPPLIKYCFACGSTHIKSLGKVVQNPIEPPPVQIPF